MQGDAQLQLPRRMQQRELMAMRLVPAAQRLLRLASWELRYPPRHLRCADGARAHADSCERAGAGPVDAILQVQTQHHAQALGQRQLPQNWLQRQCCQEVDLLQALLLCPPKPRCGGELQPLDGPATQPLCAQLQRRRQPPAALASLDRKSVV